MARDQREQEQYRPAYPPDPQKNMVYRTQDDWTAYPEAPYDRERTGYYAPASSGQSWAVGGTPRKQRHNELWVAAALISAAVLALMIYYLYTLYQPSIAFRQKVERVQQDTFAEGVVVDGVHIGGMTRAEANRVLQQGHQQLEGNLNITLLVDDQTWVITPEELPFQRNIDATLDTAYAIGRQGNKETLSSSITPMEYRYAHLYHTASNGAY
ncbi:MAG: hypothetical protein E7324_09580 [Clostridiales bacterium]|nr:hypothetical protein [Clostridiales bacterium]